MRASSSLDPSRFYSSDVQNDLCVISHQYCVSGNESTYAEYVFFVHSVYSVSLLVCELSFQGAILTTMLVSRNFSGK